MDSVKEISGLATKKKLVDSTSANLLILDSILTNLHLKYSNSYILVYYEYLFYFLFFLKCVSKLADFRDL